MGFYAIVCHIVENESERAMMTKVGAGSTSSTLAGRPQRRRREKHIKARLLRHELFEPRCMLTNSLDILEWLRSAESDFENKPQLFRRRTRM